MAVGWLMKMLLLKGLQSVFSPHLEDVALPSSCCCCLLFSCFLCSLSMSSSLTSSLRTSGMRNSSVQMLSGRCFRTSRVSYILGHFLLTFLGRAALRSTRPTLKRTLTPSQRNMSQMRSTEGQGSVLEKMQRNHSVM